MVFKIRDQSCSIIFFSEAHGRYIVGEAVMSLLIKIRYVSILNGTIRTLYLLQSW